MREFGLAPERIDEVARDPARVMGFVEVHIEQGPVLERERLPVGVVTAITGIERHSVRIAGRAGHAGTTPMVARHDALTAGAEIVLFVERLCRETERLVGVVGRLAIEPGSVSVIPALCELTVELRSPDREIRLRARDAIYTELERVAATRGVTAETTTIYEAEGIECSPGLVTALETAIERCGLSPKRIFSGAGHDGLAMAELTDVGMLFVRCRDGLSHRADESITAADADAAARVLIVLLETLIPYSSTFGPSARAIAPKEASNR
jgi:allantoate deiminase